MVDTPLFPGTISAQDLETLLQLPWGPGWCGVVVNGETCNSDVETHKEASTGCSQVGSEVRSTCDRNRRVTTLDVLQSQMPVRTDWATHELFPGVELGSMGAATFAFRCWPTSADS